jgi:hypothetical protein
MHLRIHTYIHTYNLWIHNYLHAVARHVIHHLTVYVERDSQAILVQLVHVVSKEKKGWKEIWGCLALEVHKEYRDIQSITKLWRSTSTLSEFFRQRCFRWKSTSSLWNCIGQQLSCMVLANAHTKRMLLFLIGSLMLVDGILLFWKEGWHTETDTSPYRWTVFTMSTHRCQLTHDQIKHRVDSTCTWTTTFAFNTSLILNSLRLPDAAFFTQVFWKRLTRVTDCVSSQNILVFSLCIRLCLILESFWLSSM